MRQAVAGGDQGMNEALIIGAVLLIGIGLVASQLIRLKEWLDRQPPPEALEPSEPPAGPGQNPSDSSDPSDPSDPNDSDDADEPGAPEPR